MKGQSEVNYFSIAVEDAFTISFQRTLRIPDDGRVYPLPPSLGAFPIFDSGRYPGTPASWRAAGDLFFPMYRREAMWIGLRGSRSAPRAVLVGLGDVNSVSGKEWTLTLTQVPQNYLVCPPQPWLDGINAGEGKIRQFVAVVSGSGKSVEAQLSSKPEAGGLRIAVFRPKPGFVPSAEEDLSRRRSGASFQTLMGLAAGGQMEQKIYPDPYGVDIWEPEPAAVLRIHIVDSADFLRIAGNIAPPTPISAKDYTEHGLPWFALYDETAATVPAVEELRKVKSLSELERERGKLPEDDPVEIPAKQIWKLTVG